VVGQLPTTSDPSTGVEPPFGKWYNDDVVLYDEGSDSQITPPFGKWYNDQVVLFNDGGGNATSHDVPDGNSGAATPGVAAPMNPAAVDALMSQYATGAAINAPPVDVNGDGAINLSDFALMKSAL
jgi:hypothetical protein